MFKVSIEQITKGKKKKERNFTSEFECERVLKKSFAKMRVIDVYGIVRPLLKEIKDNLLADTLNEAPRHRDTEKPLNHFVTGDLFRSVNVDPVWKIGGDTTFTFGYFIDYGLNLETGGPTSNWKEEENYLRDQTYGSPYSKKSMPFPIITKLWEKHKADISDKIINDVFKRFKQEFN